MLRRKYSKRHSPGLRMLLSEAERKVVLTELQRLEVHYQERSMAARRKVDKVLYMKAAVNFMMVRKMLEVIL